jgi:5-methylcytosine-specific restriction endonuclease McrA
VTYVRKELRQFVFERAKGRCEYCLIHHDDAYMPHEVDHIYAEKHETATEEYNLCLSCAECNRNKGSDLASIDPLTNEIVRLFHPRQDHWHDHFELKDSTIQAKTAIGRVTIKLLKMNDPERLLERQILIESGHYPRE